MLVSGGSYGASFHWLWAVGAKLLASGDYKEEEWRPESGEKRERKKMEKERKSGGREERSGMWGLFFYSSLGVAQFTNAIGFEGKFYALSLHGTLAVIEFVHSHPKLIELHLSRAVPSVASGHFRECLIESNGEILLVFLISRKSTNVVDCVKVHKLEFSRLSWERMESIRDMPLFVGTNCCMAVTASEVGCRGNCVYVTNQAFDGWWLYDVETEIISLGWTNGDSTTKSPM
ncbi:hypothetical protein NMG60_11019048 [Bertholletia excelsa]